MPIAHKELKQAIHKSQHCQRNWDLSKKIPQEDLDVLVTAITQCPSKQNVAFYNAHFVTNRELIEKIHTMSVGFTVSYDPPEVTTNPQVLANLLVVFEEADINLPTKRDEWRNTETKEFAETQGNPSTETMQILKRDQNMAIGIAAGYMNLTASLLGYATGCCLCMDASGIKDLLGLKREPLLLMGIGFKNPAISRLVHHANPDFIFPTKPKQPIQVNFVH